MSARFSIQDPYVVATLPQPIDHSNGRYVVGEVQGGTHGSKKRKRSELAVGIHGEGVNLYDLATSRLITSYAIPPQSTFTCPPCSTRVRLGKAKIERRTYVSITGSQPSITLFQDISSGSDISESSTVSKKLENSEANVVFLGTISAQQSKKSKKVADLLVVKEDGEIQCVDGQSLEKRWLSPAGALYQDATAQKPKENKVEFAQVTNGHAASQGILKGRQDFLATFGQEISENGFNPDILVLITSSTTTETTIRYLHILALPRKLSAFSTLNQSVDCLLTAKLNDRYSSASQGMFSLHASSGMLQELSGSVLFTYDLNDTLPKLQSKLSVPGAKSFLRISSSSAMLATDTSIGVYNPKYQSVLATVSLKESPTLESSKRSRHSDQSQQLNLPTDHILVAYFQRLSTAIAVAGNSMIAIQIENNSAGKSHGSGLLIDSLGRAIRQQRMSGGRLSKAAKVQHLTTLASYLPGSIGGPETWAQQTSEADVLWAKRDVDGFEEVLSSKLSVDTTTLLTNNSSGGDKVPSKSAHFSVDRRWICYALQKIFSWSKDEDEKYRLSIDFYPPRTLAWLVQTGNLTTANIEIALRNEIRSSSEQSLPSDALVEAVIEIDRELELLLALLDNNHLRAEEILHAIRKLMESLELIGDNANTKKSLLTNGEVPNATNGNADEEAEEELALLEAQVEEDLRLAEYQLGPGSGIRAQALSIALAKLYTSPSSTVVQALQATMSGKEVVSLIYLLRFELARGSWTSRYLDAGNIESADEETEVLNSTVLLISSLLNSCIDAIGAGGWLAGDARLINGDFFESEELIKSLKLEVNAALEGIEEASYLKGLTSEFIRYGDAVLRGVASTEMQIADAPATKKRKVAPITLPSLDQSATMLPLGLKAEQQVSRMRVGAGGEVQRRSARDVGRLKSKKVGKYSLERIVI